MNRYFNDLNKEAEGGGGGGIEDEGGGQLEPAYHKFQGKIIVVDLAEIDGQTQEFLGCAWLERRVREKLHFGWDVEWQPDRSKETNNPILLMQFSDESTCLLLRTHRTSSWLPVSVMKALRSEGCKKISVGWDWPDKQKMQRTFNLEPVGVVDLSQIAESKGIKETGLKSMTEHFGLRMRKEQRIARSDWACHQLSTDQQYYAAEDAYFSFLLYEKLNSLPDAARADQEGFANINQGVLELRDGWTEQGIVRKHDGLYCTICDKGPMVVPMVVERHMEGAKHRKKLEVQRNDGKDLAANDHQPAPGELEEKYVINCIIAGDGIRPECKLGEYKCELCSDGPFNSLCTVDAHIGSKKHMKAMQPDAEMTWNMPDYVTVEDGSLFCRLCSLKVKGVVPMFMHLGGNQHAKQCKSQQQEQIWYNKDRQRLERLDTGRPVVRRGCEAPRRPDAKKASSAAPPPRPGGREERVDAAGGRRCKPRPNPQS